jgi:glucan endo-1,3-alpha-glucosidase
MACSGKDSYNQQQLGFAYAAAANLGFKVFISFDFAYWTAGGKKRTQPRCFSSTERSFLVDTSTMTTYMQTYATQSGQFMYNNAAFVSSFVGDGYPYRTLESQSGIKLFACPNWQPHQQREVSSVIPRPLSSKLNFLLVQTVE